VASRHLARPRQENDKKAIFCGVTGQGAIPVATVFRENLDSGGPDQPISCGYRGFWRVFRVLSEQNINEVLVVHGVTPAQPETDPLIV
jgi:hypothetical protein